MQLLLGSRVLTEGKIIYFGTGGVAEAYCQNTRTKPDIFVDNDEKKWGKSFKGVKIYDPNILKKIQVKRLVITSSFLREIMPQVLKLGVPGDIISTPSKKTGSLQLFRDKAVRLEAARRLFELMNLTSDEFDLIAVGGTALGFLRGNDFILWDDDIDLFAPMKFRKKLMEILDNQGFEIEVKSNSDMLAIGVVFKINSMTSVPVSIDFFRSENKTFIDTFEDYSWEWITSSFTNPEKVQVHGYELNVPREPEKYLSKVYGKSWNVPNPSFGYADYQGSKD